MAMHPMLSALKKRFPSSFFFFPPAALPAFLTGALEAAAVCLEGVLAMLRYW